MGCLTIGSFLVEYRFGMVGVFDKFCLSPKPSTSNLFFDFIFSWAGMFRVLTSMGSPSKLPLVPLPLPLFYFAVFSLLIKL